MARPRNFDPQQVLEKAVDIFRESGFEGTSVPELVDRLGVCRQSLYNAFGDKRGLFLAALEQYGVREVDAKLALLREPGSALENLRTVVRGWAALATHCPGEGCLTAAAIFESRGDDEALAIVESQVDRLEDGFCEALEKAREAGELRSQAQPRRLARALTSACYGIGVLSRLPGSGPRIADSVASLLHWIDAAAVPQD